MPISFSMDSENKIVRSVFTGMITDKVQEKAYQELYSSDFWIPGYPELVDLTQADFAQATSQGLMKVAQISEDAMRKHGVQFSPTAVVAPANLQYGIGRMYSGIAGNSAETVKVFRNESKAIAWINEVRPPTEPN